MGKSRKRLGVRKNTPAQNYSKKDVLPAPLPPQHLVDNSAHTGISDITEKVNNQVSKNYLPAIKDFLDRTYWFSIFLFVFCVLGILVMMILSLSSYLFAIICSFVFAGVMTLVNTFINQRRFHYRYLILNEGSTRFISVLGSFLLGKILRLGESTSVTFETIFTFFSFFFFSAVMYCVSAYYTNKLKNCLGDSDRHICEQDTIVYSERPIPLEEGFGQKKCGNTDTPAWFKFRRELDKITNRNLQFFLGFLALTIIMFVIFRLIEIRVLPAMLPII